MPRKALDPSRLAGLGWAPRVLFEVGVAATYRSFLRSVKQHEVEGMMERLYRALYRIRRVEEQVAEVYPSDKVMSPVHMSIGQEAVSVGVCEVLGPDDVVFGSYRCHALYLAKGGDLKGMIAELYGKAAGCAKGKAGSMHLIDAPAGMMGASAVVGTTIPLAVGAPSPRRCGASRQSSPASSAMAQWKRVSSTRA